MKRLTVFFLMAVTCGALTTTRDASAQGLAAVGPALGPPKVQWLGARGDASGTPGSTSRALEPLRLSLLSEAVPSGRATPGCEGSPESTGTATAGVPGFASQYATAFRLVPRLTLFGFARGGCAVDAGVGGGLVFTQPVTKNVSLVASAGVLHLPHFLQGKPATGAMLRADVVIDRGQGRSWTVGISNRGLSFGGLW